MLHVSSELFKGQDLSELCVERSAVGVEGSAQEQLPTIFFFPSEISEAPFFQRALSPERELMRVSAVVIFFLFFRA